jgi:hypothetical protein
MTILPLAARLRADLEARHKYMCRLQRFGYACIALLVIIAAWTASRIALGTDDSVWFVFLNAVLAGHGLRMTSRRWASWLAMRADFEREIERLEKTPE